MSLHRSPPLVFLISMILWMIFLHPAAVDCSDDSMDDIPPHSAADRRHDSTDDIPPSPRRWPFRWHYGWYSSTPPPMTVQMILWMIFLHSDAVDRSASFFFSYPCFFHRWSSTFSNAHLLKIWWKTYVVSLSYSCHYYSIFFINLLRVTIFNYSDCPIYLHHLSQ